MTGLPALDVAVRLNSPPDGARNAEARYPEAGGGPYFWRDSCLAHLEPMEKVLAPQSAFDGDHGVLHVEAGLMLRNYRPHWIKADIQRPHLNRRGGAGLIQTRNFANRWQLPHATAFPERPVQIRPKTFSHAHTWCRARFTKITLGAGVARALHEESKAT